MHIPDCATPYSALIVDDERIPREILKNYLPWSDFGIGSVYEAEDGEAALALVREKKPSIIISDIKMPRMNGMALAEAVRELMPECQFVFLSGYSDKEYLKGAIKLKAASYVEKPIDLEEISGVLRDITAQLDKNRPRDPRLIFFRNLEDSGRPLNDTIYHHDEELDRQLGEAIRNGDSHTADMLLSRLHSRLSSCEGTSPDTVRQLFCQIVYIYLDAARSRNITAITGRTDAYLYAAAGGKTLSDLYAALRELSRVYFEAARPDSQDPFTRASQYIEKHYMDSNLTLQGMARKLGYTNTYLCAAYKKSCGCTINHRITEVRLRHSMELLRTTSLKLHEIACACGYTDSGYFTRVFTRETGLTPRAYRERHRNGTGPLE